MELAQRYCDSFDETAGPVPVILYLLYFQVFEKFPQVGGISSGEHSDTKTKRGIGRFVSDNSRKGFWGQNAIESISKLHRTELPGLRGFSASMIKRMRTFYEAWREIECNSVIPITENTKINNMDKSVIPITDLDVIYPLKLTGYEEFPIVAFLNISFSHHSMILRYTETLDERKYYIQLAYNQRLKVDDLETLLKAKVYKKQDRIRWPHKSPFHFTETHITKWRLPEGSLHLFCVEGERGYGTCDADCV